MKHILIFTIILFFSSQIFVKAQNSVEYTPSNGLRLSYMGSVTYPGFKLGFERASKSNAAPGQLLSEKPFTRERYISYSLGVYHHPTFHDNLFAQVEWNLRRQRNKGMYYEFAPGAGFSRTFLQGATYGVDSSGEVSKVPMAGNFYALLSVSGSMGYNFSLKGNLPGKVFLKPGLIFLLPYNKLAYTRPTVEVGYTLNVR